MFCINEKHNGASLWITEHVCACVTGQDVGCNAIFFYQIYFSHMTHRQLPFAPEAQPAAIVIGIHVFFTSIFLFLSLSFLFRLFCLELIPARAVAFQAIKLPKRLLSALSGTN